MPEVVELNRIQQLAPYRAAWHRLLAETRGATFFQTPEWLEVYWKHFGHQQKLRLLVVLDRGEPMGIVPLTVCRDQTRLGQLKVLTYPLHSWGSFFGPIGRDATATLAKAMEHVANTPRDWELLDLRFVQRDGVDALRTPTAMQAAGFEPHEAVWDETAVIDMAEGWDSYWASRESKVRNNLKRHQKRLLELGETRHERFRPAPGEDPRLDIYDTCVAIAKQSWQGQSTSGTTLSHPAVHDYLRETHAVAAQLGCVDMNVIYLNDEPIGFGYNYCYDGALQGIRIGYLPDYAKAGVGNMLYLYTFQDSFARGDKQFDLGVGSLDIKRFWYTRTIKSYRYTHYPWACPRAQLLRLKHWWTAQPRLLGSGKQNASVVETSV